MNNDNTEYNTHCTSGALVAHFVFVLCNVKSTCTLSLYCILQSLLRSIKENIKNEFVNKYTAQKTKYTD